MWKPGDKYYTPLEREPGLEPISVTPRQAKETPQITFKWSGIFVPEIIREKEIENGLRQAEKTPKTKE